MREGDYWTISFAARVLRIRDAKGLMYLAHLLRRPGRPVSALDLAEQGASFDGLGRARKRRNSAAAGYAPEPRSAGLERARTAVTKRIREAIRRIEAHDPALGHHLSTCVKTGYECVYLPGPEPVLWQVTTGATDNDTPVARLVPARRSLQAARPRPVRKPKP